MQARMKFLTNCIVSTAAELLLFKFYYRDFKRGDVLHIALSNSESKIFEFNENGISSSSSGSYLNWTNFLCVSLATLPCIFSEFDKFLENTITMDIWAAER